MGLGPRCDTEQLVEVALAPQVVHGYRGQEERGVRDPVVGPDPQTVPRRRGAILEVGDQKRRGEPDQLPSREQGLDRTGQRGDHHAQQEQRVEHEEAIETPLAMKVLGGERADRARQDERQNGHRDRQPIEEELEREVVVRGDRHPIPQADRHMPRTHREHRDQDRDSGEQPRDHGDLNRSRRRLLGEFPVQQR